MISIDSADEPRAIVSPSSCGPGDVSIHDAVRRKGEKLAAYRATVDEAWLLLVTGATWTQATDSVTWAYEPLAVLHTAKSLRACHAEAKAP